MLEGPLKSWICYFLGQYVESQSVQVSAKLWKSSERLKLENLTLKASIIPSWLPFRLKSGFIGQFEADLPISAIFGSASAKIKFVDVLLVLEPLQHDDAELQDEIAALVEQKMQHLEQDLLDRWSGPQVPEYTVPHESEGYFGTDGWIGRTMTKLIDNLQIDVRNLHIRIEGTWYPTVPMPPSQRMHTPPSSSSSQRTQTPPNSASSSSSSAHQEQPAVKFAAGITLGALSAVTTPSNWRIDGFDDEKPAVGAEQSHLVFKLISALDLSAYVDPYALHCIHSRVHPKVMHSTLARLREMGSKTAPTDWWTTDASVHTHRFLIAPIAVSLKLTMNTATQHAQTGDPRYDAVFHLSKLAVALDEDQLSVLNLILDAYSGHEQWRVMVSEHLKATERHAASDAEKLALVAQDYVTLWHEIVGTKRDDLEALKKTDVWTRATLIEQQLPFELVVSLRNQSTAVADTCDAKAVPFASLLHEVGDAMGIPLPEISVVFPKGLTGLVFDVSARDGDVVVKRCVEKSVAASKDAIKPGLLLIKVDGKPLATQFRVKTALDLQLQIDAMDASRVLTFRHPLVKPAEVTPLHLVSRVSLTSDTLTFRLVRAATKSLIAEATLDHPLVVIKGFGPDLFAYHRYEVSALDYFIQNKAFDDGGGNYCVASSVSEPSGVADALELEGDAQRAPSLMLVMDYLYDAHPDAVKGRVATYGSKISLHLGDSVLVFDEQKMTKLLEEWYAWSSSISTQYTSRVHPSIGTGLSTIPSGTTSESMSLSSPSSFAPTSSLPTSLASEPLSASTATAATTSSYAYEIKMDHLQFFVSAAKKVEPPSSMKQQPSYRVLLKQLVNKESATAVAIQPDWVKATRAIVVMQRFIRGCIVRKRKMVRLALTKSRWMYYQGDEMMGWLFTRDDTLAFRRWRRSWCHLDEDAIFSVHENGSGADLLDAFKVMGCKVILLPNVRGGPYGGSADSRRCNLLEIRTSTGVLCKVLSSTNMTELEKWKSCIESSARNALKRALSEDDDDGEADEYDRTLYGESAYLDDVSSYSSGGVDSRDATCHSKSDSGKARLSQHSRYLAPEHILLGGFSDAYRPSTELFDEKATWITFSASDLVFAIDVHGVSEPERSAFRLFLGVKYLSAVDHRRESNHAFLHVGDEFLNLKNGILTPAKLRSDRVQTGPFLALRVTYRGALAAPDVFVVKKGLHVDMDVTGWVMPLNLTDLLFEVVDVLDVLWTDPNQTASTAFDIDFQPVTPTNPAPWYKVSELLIHIRAPMLEAYVEDSHCVAKLSIEKSSCSYRADASMENLKVHLGPTALFVLTEEVALRLAQVDKFWCAYDLRLHKMTTETPLECALCADESGRRPHCHRSVVLSLGQVKLEADRRLELLFALLEAVTHSDAPPPQEDLLSQTLATNADDCEEKEQDVLFASPGDFSTSNSNNNVRSTEFLPTERMQSMQFSFNDNDLMELRPMYAGFGSRNTMIYGSPTSRSRVSRISTATSAGPANFQSHEHDLERARPRSTASSFIPLLNYQTYFGILGDVSESKQLRHRTLFRTRLRIGRIHDRLTMSCYSVVFEVIKRSLSVVALDTYIPVMNFALSDMKLQCLTRSEFTLDYVVDASLEISARYYNTALADWEPFVEPWRAYAKVRNDEGGAGTSIEISAMQRLNINFTDAFVRLLSSVAKNRRRQVMYVEKRTPAAVAADGEAKKEDGRVCVLNNLGVPIRLANLNTSHAGTLHVEVRDGWNFPGYARFHDVRVEVMLLPWWNPREAKTLANLRHKFALPYGGAQSGVTPILRIDVLSTDKGKRNFVFDHVTNKYVEVDDDADESEDFAPQSASASSRRVLGRDESSSVAKEKWFSIGTVEINLAGSVMGSIGTKLSRWYRLHDVRGNATGEIFLALDFVPHSRDARHDARLHEPEQVKDGQFLVFDPLKIVATKDAKTKTFKKQASSSNNNSSSSNCSTNKTGNDTVVLSEGLRGSYIPPLALEVMIGSTRSSLLCPLRRAGKFLIQGDKVLAEVKVAQRDESRRVLLLSSPVQLKNGACLVCDVDAM